MQELESSQHPKSNGAKNGTTTKPPPKKETPVKKETPSKRKVVEVDSEDDDDFIPAPKIAQSSISTPKKPAPAKPPPIKKEPVKPPTKAPATAAPKAAKTSKKPDEAEDAARKAILDSIETVGLPDTEPPTDGKFNFRAVAARPGPQALGSKEVPVGEEDCLTVRPRSMSIHLYSRD